MAKSQAPQMNVSSGNKAKIRNWLLNNEQAFIFGSISLLLTFWFCKFIFSPSAQMLGVDYQMGTADAYSTLAAMTKDISVLQSGHFPGGAFWLPDFYGGSIATWFHIGAIPDLTLSAYLAINFFLNDLILSLKVLAFILLAIAQVSSYKLAKYYFHNVSIAWIISIGYSFSAFFASKLIVGHTQFVFGAAFFPLVALLFEKMFASPSRKNMALASAALIILFLTDLQITIFSAYYLLFRFSF
jgi:hypothetical protein